jgi:predicted ATP-grasp superfamily ATP-dependent carboligase
VTSVLVLDSKNKNALAAIRSLGRRGIDVISGSTRRLTRGAVSKYSARSIVYPSPEDEARFVECLADAVDHLGVDVVLPIGDATTRVLSKHKEEFGDRAAIPIAGWEAMEVASDKLRTLTFVDRLGIPTPATFEHVTEVDRFPVVVKQRLGAGGVRYVNTAGELALVDTSNAVVQEYVPGEGWGFFALFDQGRERAVFMHRRIREYPVTGGASTAAESVYDPTLRALGLTVLRALAWHGVAMVEFKKDARDFQYKLMEINPKFWGSLDLSIAAGVDFPWLAVKLALGTLTTDVFDYRIGLRFRWLFEDLVHLAARPSAFRDVVRDFRPEVEDDLCRDDLKPAVFDAGNMVRAVATRAVRRRLRHPHGKPILAHERHSLADPPYGRASPGTDNR